MTLNELTKEYIAKGLPDKDIEQLKKISPDSSAFRRLAQRRLFGEPFAFLENKATFYGRDFYIDRRCYVPNPETEQLAKAVISEAKPNSAVIDVGTGSGAIAITIAKERSDLTVYAVGLDPAALEVTRINAKRHQAPIQVQESCYVDDINLENVDYIVADLPYGNAEEYLTPSNNVKELEHMPPISVFHPQGVLTAYAELIESIKRRGWKPTIFIETGAVSESVVRAELPKDLTIGYRPNDGHSMTIVDML